MNSSEKSYSIVSKCYIISFNISSCIHFYLTILPDTTAHSLALTLYQFILADKSQIIIPKKTKIKSISVLSSLNVIFLIIYLTFLSSFPIISVTLKVKLESRKDADRLCRLIILVHSVYIWHFYI